MEWESCGESLSPGREFAIPPYDKETLNTAVAQCSGVEQDIVKSMVWAVQAIQKLKDKRVDAVSLGWLSIWEKFYEASRAALAGLRENSSLSECAATRSVNELTMVLQTIMEPVSKEMHSESYVSGETKLPWDDVSERFRAYTAWCVVNDFQRYDHLLERAVLHDIFDPQPGRRLLRGDPKSLAMHTELFGEVEDVSDSEAENDRKRFEKGVRGAKRKLKELSKEFELEAWIARVKPGAIFFTLFDDAQKSIPNRLRATGMRFAYGSFIRSSQILHASSFDLSVALSPTIIGPRPANDDEEIEDDTKEVASLTRSAMLVLHMLADRLSAFC
jgi:hypothetical protein